MWAWLERLFNRDLQRAVASMPKSTVHKIEGFWELTNGKSLAQGDFLRGCLLPAFGPNVRLGEQIETVVWTADVIVITQSCDLENAKVQFVGLCPIYSLEEFARTNAKFKSPGDRNEMRKGRIEGLHMLGSPTNPNDNLESLVVDFRQIYSLPIAYLSAHAESLGDRWRLQSPYLEHFSQAFARFFMRVGLPSSIPLFK